MLLAAIPFWFLPKSLPKQGETETEKESNVLEGEQNRFIPDDNKHSNAPDKPAPVSMAALAKGVHFIKYLNLIFFHEVCLLSTHNPYMKFLIFSRFSAITEETF